MATILNAVKALANVCDGASTRDHVGFNGRDTDFGKSLAQRSWLTEKQQIAALKMLKTYTKQLSRYGIDYTTLHVDTSVVKPAEIIPTAVTHTQLFPTSGSIAQPKNNPRKATLQDTRIVFQFPYDAMVKDALKDFFPRKAFFDGTSKTWSVPATELTKAIAFAEKYAFDHTSLSFALIDAQNALHAANTAAELAYLERIQPIQDLLHGAALSDGKILRSYQVDGIKTILKTQHIIVADDMGLGKTLQALVAAKAYQHQGYAIFVVAPISLHANWLREASTVHVQIEVFSWAKIPSIPESTKYILICDEAHYAQNLKSQRTQKMLDIRRGYPN